MQSFNRTDVEKSFTKTILVRGADYVRMRNVLEAWYQPDGQLCGRVRGSEKTPYDVSIIPTRRSGFVELDSSCTCPYFSQCKHAAAVATFALSHELEVKSEGASHSPEPEEEIFIPQAPPVSVELTLPEDVRTWLKKVEVAATATTSEATDGLHLLYELKTTSLANSPDIPLVVPITRTALKSGGMGVRHEVKVSSINTYNKPKQWKDSDYDLILDLNSNAIKLSSDRPEFRLDGKHGVRLLKEILESGHCLWKGESAVRLGPTRKAVLRWEPSDSKGSIKPQISFEGKGSILATTPPWYVDLTTNECGPVDCGVRDDLAAKFIGIGSVAPEFVPAVRARLASIGLKGQALPDVSLAPSVRASTPVPVFVVDFESCEKEPDYWNASKVAAPVAFGKLTFEYEGHSAPANGSDVRLLDGDEIVIIKRNHQAESLARSFLDRCGWGDTKYSGWVIPPSRGGMLCIVPPDSGRLLDPLERVAAFSKNIVPKLVATGWRVDVDQNYRFIPDSDIEWNVGVDSAVGIDWFEFKLGIQVEGQPYDLKPVLLSLFKEMGHSVGSVGTVARTQKSDDLFVFGANGQVIRLSRQRLSAMLQPLVEIFGGTSDWPDELRLSRALLPEADKFQETLDSIGVPWKTNEELSSLGDKFAAFDHLELLAEPDGFIGELRVYQREGLAWLQFLREFGFGGVLADDMGLGKTVQVLAHIQAEKNSGRMTRPCLIVAPTSTIPNWIRECERFVPELKIVSLQGAGRYSRFGDVREADIALTTYPLLARDKGPLLQANYHIVVLDEAQNVKNPSTAAAKAARDLKGLHKLCLSGTPIENHLSELWSLFHFLMPGFLGSDSEFKKEYRTPIEKFGDGIARERLSRRVRPFMLRRTKGQVVKELPPKTEIIETIAFDDPQRDLYESIRITMDEQVRNLIAAQGFDRSRIQILDALLKLRQVCCDPRLVKLASARSVTDSAKLDRLMEMLVEMIENGRKVLLFSQFTSMLNLIEERLKAVNLQWVRISGDTVDRDTPVRRFQAGDVPLFLISLKAGGTGLNLTAADTVILYDPWWNPAVENQAIDRAHRIGQEKAVNVYKLVAAGTIEEKMLEMQARKGDIAKSILTDDAEGIRTLTAEDLRWVLAKD